MKRIFFVMLLLFLLCLCIPSQPAMKAPEAIRKADGDWLKAVQSKDLVKVLAFTGMMPRGFCAILLR